MGNCKDLKNGVSLPLDENLNEEQETDFLKKKTVSSDTSSEEVEDKKYRNFMLLLYPEWSNFKEILQDIKGSFKNYAYIKQMPEEDEKKEHVHVIISLDNPRTENSLAKRLEIDPRFVRRIKSLRGSCRYLIHLDNEEKFQYSLDQVFVSKSFKSTYYKAFDDLLSDEEVLESIYSFIDDHKSVGCMKLEIELTKFVCSNAYERIFKRYYSTIVKYISFVCDESSSLHNI